MPQLAQHQLRVGGIVSLITKDKAAILTALVHDMGNIVKFSNLDLGWTSVQEIFQKKYGRDANLATLKILDDAGLTKLRDLVEQEAEFYQNVINIEDFSKVSLPAALTLYADSRVAIDGVVSLEERIVDLETRYKQHRSDREWAYKLEDYVQSLSRCDVKSITEEMVTPLFDELLTYRVE